MLDKFIEQMCLQEAKEIKENIDCKICFWDIMWEQYFLQVARTPYVADFCEEYVEDRSPEEEEKSIEDLELYQSYKGLLKIDENKHDDSFDFIGVNAGKKKIISNNFCNSLGWEYEYDKKKKTVTMPDKKFLALHILFLQNSDFIELFCNKNRSNIKQEKKNEKNIIYFGNKLEDYNNGTQYGYLYEKLTGVNLALLFMNYYVIFVNEINCPVNEKIDISRGIWKTGDSERNSIILERKKKEIKECLREILLEIIDLPTVYQRIFKADKILFQAYKEMVIYKKTGVRGNDTYKVSFCESEWTEMSTLWVGNVLVEALEKELIEFKKDKDITMIRETYNTLCEEFSKSIDVNSSFVEEIERGVKEDWKDIKKELNRKEIGYVCICSMTEEYIDIPIEIKVTNKTKSEMPIIFINNGMHNKKWEGEWSEVSSFLVDALDAIRKK